MKVGDRVRVESKDIIHEGIVLPSPENQKIKIIIFLIILTIFAILTSQSAYANHQMSFATDKAAYIQGKEDVVLTLQDTDNDGAFISSNEKYFGAKEANDKYWMQIHSEERKKYAALVAKYLKEYYSALNEFKLLILNNGADVIITKADLINFQDKLRLQGASALPQLEIAILKDNLGGTDAEVQKLVNNILSIDPNSWVDEPITIKIEQAIKTNEKFISILDAIANLPSTDKNKESNYLIVALVFIIVTFIIITKRRNKHG